MGIIDLTRKISAGMPVYPGDPGVSLNLLCAHGTDPCQVTDLQFGSHTGTHLDSPLHFLRDGKGLTELSLERFVGEALCLKAGLYYAGGEEHPVIELSDEEKSKILPGDKLILSTGWEDKSGTDEYYVRYPIFSAELLDFLMSKGIRLLGVDLPTVEAVDSFHGGKETQAGEIRRDPHAMHKTMLGRDIIPVEGLINLRTLIGRRFFFCAAPLLLENGDGSPVRAFAIVEDER